LDVAVDEVIEGLHVDMDDRMAGQRRRDDLEKLIDSADHTWMHRDPTLAQAIRGIMQRGIPDGDDRLVSAWPRGLRADGFWT
jgi:hypothetical protein